MDFELEKPAGSRIGVVLTDFYFQRSLIVIDTIAEDSVLFGMLAPGDVLVSINGATPTSSDDAAELIVNATHWRLEQRDNVRPTVEAVGPLLATGMSHG